MSEPVAPTAGSESASFAALKRVKAVETEWAAKLAGARSQSDLELARLREESATALKAAIADADRERAAALGAARTELAGVAATIVAQGSKAAEAALRAEGKDPDEQKDRLLAVILGAFASD